MNQEELRQLIDRAAAEEWTELDLRDQELTELPPEIFDNVGWLREQTKLPICIGFGISRAEHVRMLSPVADGLIVGSAIVRRVSQAAEKPREQVLEEVGNFVAELAAALE